MKRRIQVIALLLGVALISIGVAGSTATEVTIPDVTGTCTAHPCDSEDDCPRGLTCCPSGFCGLPRACR